MTAPAPASLCDHCGKPAPEHQRACSWDCIVAKARANGAREHLPNGLPPAGLRYDGSGGMVLVECDGGDHPTYLFPVEALRTDLPPDHKYRVETHALIYTDGCVAVTLSEHQYYAWHPRNDGECLGAPSGSPFDHRLSPASCEAIAAHMAKQPPDPRHTEPRR